MKTTLFPTTTLLLLAAAPMFAAENPSSPPPQVPGYKVVFQEEFDRVDVSPSGLGSYSWYVNVWFNHKRPPMENISASGSALSLVWRDSQESSDTSITTMSHDGHHAHAWHYGYFEARLRWDVVKGAWPAFWLIPVEGGSDASKSAKETGELDVFEGQGDHPTTFYGTIHDWVDGKRVASTSNSNSFQLPAGTDLSAYHTYGLLWEPGKVTWYFDNQPLHSETTYPIFDKQHYYLILGMQEGANWRAGDRTGVTAHSMTMNVDWVRVWQK
jgi:hypothetical protein